MSQLNIEKRESSANLRILRMTEKVPAVVYGHNREPELISVSSLELQKIASKRGFFTRVLTLVAEGSSQDVLIKDIQMDPLNDVPIHADFMRISKEQRIRIFVPIAYVDAEKSTAIKRGGVLNIVHHELEVRCSPYEIPQELTCDLSQLDTHRPATLAALNLPENVSPVHPQRDNVLATVVAVAEEKESAEESASA